MSSNQPSVRAAHSAFPNNAQSSRPLPQRANPPSQGMDPDVPRYDPFSKSFYGNPEAYAAKFPDSWEANAFREGKYPAMDSFVHGQSDPHWSGPTSNVPVALESYASAVAGRAGPGKKGRKKAQPGGAQQVAAMSKPPFGELKRKPLPRVDHHFFAPRSTPSPHPRASDISATLPDLFSRLLGSNNCQLPLGFIVKVNSRGAVTVIVSDVETPTAAYAPFFNALTARLNQSFPVGNSPWLPFRLAPNESHLAIHSLPLSYHPDAPEELFSSVATSIGNAKGVNILSARFLKPDRSSREGKLATSIAITVKPQDVATMRTSIRLFSHPRRVTTIVPANHFSQWDNCCQFGHVEARCSQPQPTCPFCSVHHTKAAHRCLNPVSPKGGNHRSVLAYYEISPAKCLNCGEAHSARYRDCSA